MEASLSALGLDDVDESLSVSGTEGGRILLAEEQKEGGDGRKLYEREDDELLEDAVSSEHSVKHAKAFRYV